MAIRATFAAASSGVLNIEHDLKAPQGPRVLNVPKPHIVYAHDVVIRLFS
jgi:hypothetical protein